MLSKHLFISLIFLGHIFTRLPAINEVETQTIKLNEIFEFVTGVKDTPGINLAFNQDDNGFYYIENAKNQKRFYCGKIDYLTVGELRKKDASTVKCNNEKRKPSFKIICYTGNHPENFYQADVCALQAAQENKDAVFQLASRFHGLEGGCVHGGENRFN